MVRPSRLIVSFCMFCIAAALVFGFRSYAAAQEEPAPAAEATEQAAPAEAPAVEANEAPGLDEANEAAEAVTAPTGAETDAPETGDAPATTNASRNQVRLSELREGGVAGVAWWQRLISFFGLFGFVGLAWLMSSHRDRFPWRIVGWGMGLQLVFGLFVLKSRAGLALFGFLNDAVIALLEYTEVGSRFLFGGYLDNLIMQAQGSDNPVIVYAPFALKVLPTIIFFSSLMAILYHLGLMQRVVNVIAWAMQRTMRTSGSETLSAAANIFVGQTEAPLVVRPYLDKMTLSELNAIMCGGFATVAGGVLAAYVGMLQSSFPDIAGHLIAASVMSAPAALVIAKVMLPETQESETAGGAQFKSEKIDSNVVEAAARGATEGLSLALNVGAMLLAFIALVALANGLLGLPFQLYNHLAEANVEAWTLQGILGGVFWPIAFMMGVDPADCGAVATLLGEKLVLNEFVAYGHLSETLGQDAGALQQRSIVIITYALCGFANFSSIAIQVGGIGAIAPERRADVAKLGVRAMLGGTLAACMTASVAGLLV